MCNLFHKLLISVLIFSNLFSQINYRSIDEIESEWAGYASYQKEEMLTFCDFLFKEKHYERFLISSFQLLLKLENDPIIPTIFYFIGRSYEELGSYSLAERYYDKVLKMTNVQSKEYKAANYRLLHTYYLSGKFDEVLIKSKNLDDPYLQLIRGYALLEKAQYQNARASFSQAQSTFNHPHYNKLINPMFKVIEDIAFVKNYNKNSIFLLGILLPGGGQFMLGDLDEARGILTSFSLLMLSGVWGSISNNETGENRLYYNEANSFPIFNSYDKQGLNFSLDKKDKFPAKLSFQISNNSIVPFSLGFGLSFISAWRAYNKTTKKNTSYVNQYLENKIKSNPLVAFFDFSEPRIIAIE